MSKQTKRNVIFCYIMLILSVLFFVSFIVAKDIKLSTVSACTIILTLGLLEYFEQETKN